MCGMSIKLDPDSDLCPFSLAATLLYYATSQAFDFQETPSLRKGTTLRFKVPGAFFWGQRFALRCQEPFFEILGAVFPGH